MRTGAIIGCSLLVALTAGCAPVQGSAVSRAEIYDSIAGLVEDSSDVIVGTALHQQLVPDDSLGDITLQTVEVEQVLTPETAGTSLTEMGFDVGAVNAGSRVVIRQFSVSQGAGPPLFLQPGERYLLFLSPSGDPGESIEQYNVTGIVAGIYVEQDGVFTAATAAKSPVGSPGEVEQVDDLPFTIDPATDLGWVDHIGN